jgi:hypothetical protein
MTGSKQYVVLEVDENETVRAVWGPFSEEDDARQWEGVPGKDPHTAYHVAAMLAAPTWEEEWTD